MNQENNIQQGDIVMQQSSTAEGNVCQNCLSPIRDEDKFCPNCGATTRVTCPNCETTFPKNQAVCPVCGQKPGFEAGVAPAATPKKTNKKLIIIIASAVLVILSIIPVIVLVNSCSYGGSTGSAYVPEDTGINFYSKFSEYAGESWCTIASDGSYIKIDSNPYDVDEDDMDSDDYTATIEAVAAVKEINRELGFSEVLMEKMNNTNSLQGIQSDENENYKVSWSYHPNNGLEVIYEKN